ncbi:hypothetical protein CK507_01565 [Pseudomonas sp. WN033]|nr:hypothetical protein CK507_01565 [Pseudomonas sp. WN033]
MSFLVLVLVALILRFTPWRNGLPVDACGRWSAWLQIRMGNHSEWQRILLLMLPLLPLAALLWWVQGMAYGFFSLLLHAAVLLLCVGRSDPLGAMTSALEQAWARGDQEAASLVAERELGIACDEPNGLLRAVRGRLVWEACHGYFVPAFWYLLLGPLGALGYRLLASASGEKGGLANVLSHSLEWLPNRLLGLSLALVGHFDATLAVLRRQFARWELSNAELLEQCTDAALQDGAPTPEHEGILASVRMLVKRSLLVWAVFIALYAVLG